MNRRPAWAGECSDDNLLPLIEAQRPQGGILPVEDLLALCHEGNPARGLAESIMRGDVFTVGWRCQTWAPCFQVMGSHWTPCLRVLSITAEMRPAIEGEDVAIWFIESSP